MAFMKNTIFVFNLLESTNFKYSDYTESKYTEIHKVDELFDNTFVDFIELENDTKLELESFKLYGSEDYWDLLIAINFMDPLFSLPYNFDIIATRALADTQRYVSEVYQGTLPASHIEYLTDKRQEEEVAKNETFRTIKIIRPEKLQDFLKILRDKGFI